MMTSYAEMKDNLLVERAFSTVQGVPLDGGPYKRWIPIRPCICVTEPCPCDTLEDIIVWLPSNIKSDKTGRKWEGQDVLSYTLDPGSHYPSRDTDSNDHQSASKSQGSSRKTKQKDGFSTPKVIKFKKGEKAHRWRTPDWGF